MTNKKPPLTKKKARWAKNRDVVLRGNRLNYNAGLEAWYNRKLQNLINKMTSEVKREVSKLFKRLPVVGVGATDESIGSQARILMNKLTDKFESLFALESKNIVDELMDKNLEITSSNLHASLQQLSGGLSLKTSIVTPEVTNVVAASIAENVSLIKSIPAQYLKDVTGAVMRSITSGEGPYDLTKDIQKYGKHTARRAQLLAYDQTRKVYTSVNVAKMEKLGIKKFEWIHSGGGQKPRESHIKISGIIFSFDNLIAEQAALGVPKDDRGLPGYPINCACTMRPVIEFEDD